MRRLFNLAIVGAIAICFAMVALAGSVYDRTTATLSTTAGTATYTNTLDTPSVHSTVVQLSCTQPSNAELPSGALLSLRVPTNSLHMCVHLHAMQCPPKSFAPLTLHMQGEHGRHQRLQRGARPRRPCPFGPSPAPTPTPPPFVPCPSHLTHTRALAPASPHVFACVLQVNWFRSHRLIPSRLLMLGHLELCPPPAASHLDAMFSTFPRLGSETPTSAGADLGARMYSILNFFPRHAQWVGTFGNRVRRVLRA